MTINKKQVIKLMKEIQKGTLEKAALKVGISQKTARKYIKHKHLPSQQKEKPLRSYSNPFEAHWDKVTGMLETSPEREARTILNYLVEMYPEHYRLNQIRSLQRRLKEWRAHYGASKQVIFRQDLKPGRLDPHGRAEYYHWRLRISPFALSLYVAVFTV